MSDMIRIQALRISEARSPVSLPFCSYEERLSPQSYDEDVDDYCAASQEKPRGRERLLSAPSSQHAPQREAGPPVTAALPQNASYTAGCTSDVGWAGRICVDSAWSPQR